MAERKPTSRKPREPKQTTFIEPTSPQFKNNDVLDVDEATALLKVSRRTIYNRVKSNTIPHARAGRKLLVHKQTLTQWVADGADLAKPTRSRPPMTTNSSPSISSPACSITARQKSQ